MRGHMDPAEYKHVALGLIFLKYISDAFLTLRSALIERGDDPDERDFYVEQNIFWVPPEARWKLLQDNAKQPIIGKLVDDAMDAIERLNPSLKGVLPKDYNRPALDKIRLGELIDLISGIDLVENGGRSRDVLGRVYEYFLSEFASREGKKGGEFYTPRCIVRLLVEMIEPFQGRIYDPCCGSSGMFVQSEEFIEAHGGRIGDISIFGQESNPTTWRLARMNLAIRGIEANLGPHHADSFHNDLHRDLKADYILANPPFNDSDWGGERLREDLRWKYGLPPAGNANFAWVQHFIHHLSPRGIAGFVLANGSMSSQQSGEGDIRRAIVEADLVDCMIALPGQLFYGTQIPACLWFLTRSKDRQTLKDHDGKVFRELRARPGETLFIDARKLGALVDRTHRELTADEIARIAGTYHAWRSSAGVPAGESVGGIGVPPVTDAAGTAAPPDYTDIPGFCRSANLADIAAHNSVLTPGRYVGAEDIENDGEPFAEKMQRLTAQLYSQFEESAKLEQQIRENLRRIGG